MDKYTHKFSLDQDREQTVIKAVEGFGSSSDHDKKKKTFKGVARPLTDYYSLNKVVDLIAKTISITEGL